MNTCVHNLEINSCASCGPERLKKAIKQKHMTSDTVDNQFCSDWLKDEIKILFSKIEKLEKVAEAATTFEDYWRRGHYKQIKESATELWRALSTLDTKEEV